MPDDQRRIRITVQRGNLPARQWLADQGAWWRGGDLWWMSLPSDPAAAARITDELAVRGLKYTDDLGEHP